MTQNLSDAFRSPLRGDVGRKRWWQSESAAWRGLEGAARRGPSRGSASSRRGSRGPGDRRCAKSLRPKRAQKYIDNSARLTRWRLRRVHGFSGRGRLVSSHGKRGRDVRFPQLMRFRARLSSPGSAPARQTGRSPAQRGYGWKTRTPTSARVSEIAISRPRARGSTNLCRTGRPRLSHRARTIPPQKPTSFITHYAKGSVFANARCVL